MTSAPFMRSATFVPSGLTLATAVVWLAIAAPAAAEPAQRDQAEPRLSVAAEAPSDMPRRKTARRVRRIRLEGQRIDPIQTGSIPKLPAASAAAPTEAKAPVERVVQSDARQYCANIANAAADARYAWQAKQLADLEGQIKQRIADLEAKQAEYKTWLSKRQEALKAAEKSLVGIYAKMRPEAASSQLSALDDTTAAAVLAQLSARGASAILNEMDAKRAARLANAIAGNLPPDQQGKK